MSLGASYSDFRPNFAAAWMNLGIVLTNLNQLEEAEYCYLKAISHRNKYPDCYYNLGNLVGRKIVYTCSYNFRVVFAVFRY